VIAILHFVFGGFGLVCGLFALAMQSLFDPTKFMGMGGPPPGGAPGLDPNEMMKQVQDRMPSYMQTVAIGHEAVGVILSIIMIVAGIGLLQVRPWGRVLSILYAVVSILVKIAFAVYTFVLVIPVSREVNQIVFQQVRAQAKNPREQAMMEAIMSMADTMTLMQVVVPLFMIVYPVVVLVIMFLKSTRQAFAGEVLPVSEDDEDRRYEDERWER